MAFHSRIMPCLDCWHWQGFRIRCALLPDEPRLLEVHWAHGRALIEYGQISPWQMAASTLTLLLDSACDPALPWHWRSLCLDNAYLPLQALQHLSSTPKQQRRLNELRNRLATMRLLPSLSPSELAEGNPYE
ncbi:FagA protein [Pseudomonas sp. LRF_L74]|uniref:FagA protein n=1 Tax=Pseudomonas sp. LRF_L74 TaxID=3369422 RepID=UPI003F63A08E